VAVSKAEKTVETTELSTAQPVELRAYFIGHRLNMKALQKSQRFAVSPFVMKAGGNGYAALFRYGVAVLFGMNPVEEAAFMKHLEEFIIDAFPLPEMEEGLVRIDPANPDPEGIEGDMIRLKHWDTERIALLADIFAKNVVLSYYETQMAETFDRLEPIAERMQRGSAPNGKQARSLLSHIGLTLSIQRKMVGHVEVEEKPDLLWDRPELERLYVRLENEYELSERHDALKHKLDLVYKTAETILGLMQEKRTLHVEYYIVALIVMEILIEIADKFLF
jgi:uncharacterized Rmd1/YagE family protein